MFVEVTKSLIPELQEKVFLFCLFTVDLLRNYDAVPQSILKLFPFSYSIHIGRQYIKITSRFTGSEEIYDKYVKKLSFLAEVPIESFTVDANAVKGDWIQLKSHTKEIRLIGFSEQHLDTYFAIEDKLHIISDIPAYLADAFASQSYNFSNLQYVSVIMNDMQIPLNILGCRSIKKIVLKAKWDCNSFIRPHISQALSLLESLGNIEVAIEETGTITSIELDGLALEYLKHKSIDTLSLYPSERNFRMIPKFTRVRRLELVCPRDFAVENFDETSDCITHINIKAFCVQRSDFSRMKALVEFKVHGNVNPTTFNSLPPTVKRILMDTDRPDFFNSMAESGNYILPRDLEYLECHTFQCANLFDLSRCFKLRHVLIDHLVVSSINNYKFWQQLPKTVANIDIIYGREARNQGHLVSNVQINEMIQDLTIRVLPTNSFNIVVTTGNVFTYREQPDPDFDYECKEKCRDAVDRNYGRFYSEPYVGFGVICNLSPRVKITASPTAPVTFYCLKEETDSFVTSTDINQRQFDMIGESDGYAIFEPSRD